MRTEAVLERIVSFLEDGAINQHLYDLYLDAADQAFADMENRDIVGKLVISPRIRSRTNAVRQLPR